MWEGNTVDTLEEEEVHEMRAKGEVSFQWFEKGNCGGLTKSDVVRTALNKCYTDEQSGPPEC